MKNKVFKTIGKILSFPILKIIIGVALINVSAFIMRNLIESILYSLGINNEFTVSTLVFITRILTLYFIYKLFIWIYEKRKLEEFEFNKTSFIHFSIGSTIGIISIGLVFLFNWIFGWIKIQSINSNIHIIDGIYYNIFFALLQDIVYFLIIFKITEKYLGTYFSAIIAGLIFGGKHLLFPDYTIFSGLMIFLNGAILFPALFVKSRNIWIIFGFHFFWNYIQNSILGISIPEGQTSIFNAFVNGPAIFTGDSTGFEPSIITLLIAILIGMYYYREARKKGKIIKPIWSIKN